MGVVRLRAEVHGWFWCFVSELLCKYKSSFKNEGWIGKWQLNHTYFLNDLRRLMLRHPREKTWTSKLDLRMLRALESLQPLIIQTHELSTHLYITSFALPNLLSAPRTCISRNLISSNSHFPPSIRHSLLIGFFPTLIFYILQR